MARTKAEVRKFLDSQVGHRVNAKCGVYNGQCVSLVKALLEFLGAPNPYQARGNAKDVGDTLLRQNIAENGDGWLRVVVNRNMGVIGGVRYGHIWIDLKDETNYEQNGNRALLTTKGTRPYSQRQQVVNLDKYIKADAPAPAKKSVATVAKEVMDGKWGNGDDRKKALERAGYSYSAVQAEVNKLVSKPDRKSNAQVAREVIDGKWGNGDDRKKKLASAGYDYSAVQAEVNKLVNQKQYVTVQAGWGLSNVAQAAGFGDAWSENRWAAIARLNGSTNWRTFNNRLVPGQKVRVK